MAQATTIEWARSTFNGWYGCTQVSPACDHCFAKSMNDWLHGGKNWGPGAPRQLTGGSYWHQALRWNVKSARTGETWTVFAMSWADVFDNEADPEARRWFWGLVKATPYLTWLIVTKRIGNAPKMLPPDWGDGYPNVMVLITVSDQQEADRDIPKLLALPVRWRGLSIEPMLGPIDLDAVKAPGRDECYDGDNCRGRLNALSGWCYGEEFVDGKWEGYGDPDDPRVNLGDREHPYIDWVICGGESGRHARPSHPDWFRSLRDQCAKACTPFLFKQWGEWSPSEPVKYTNSPSAGWLPISGKLAERPFKELYPEGGAAFMDKVGKKIAGRTLDGVEHNGFPDFTRQVAT